MTRDEIQRLTEKEGELTYYSVTPLKQHGSCVEVTLIDGMTVKGQEEDANMAGGGTIFEFRKIAGRWVGLVLSKWISEKV